MRYAQIRKMDISNGEGIGVALFTQGCPFHCKGCFNPETWNYNSGKEWTKEIEEYFLSLIKPEHIERITFLGGEPLIEENLTDLKRLIKKIKQSFNNKKIWIYSGNTFEKMSKKQLEVLSLADILVDGPFILEEKNLNIPFRGSTNQRIIDIQKTFKKGEIILYNTIK